MPRSRRKKTDPAFIKSILHRLRWFWIPFMGSVLFLSLLTWVIELSLPGVTAPYWNNVVRGILTWSTVVALAVAVPSLAVEMFVGKVWPNKVDTAVRVLWVLVHGVLLGADLYFWLLGLSVPAANLINTNNNAAANILLKSWEQIPQPLQFVRADLYRNLISHIDPKTQGGADYFVRALECTERAYGAQSPQTLAALSRLAAIYVESGALSQAQTHYDRALQLAKVLFKDDSTEVLELLRSMAWMKSQKQNDVTGARDLLRQALGVSEKINDRQRQMEVLQELAWLLDGQHEYKEAETLWRRRLALIEKSTATGSTLELSDALLSLGNRFFDLGQYGAAEGEYRKSLELMQKYPLSKVQLGKTYQALGWLYQTENKFKEAEQAYIQALQAAGSEQGKTANCVLSELASLNDKQKKYEEADKLYAREEQARASGKCCLLLPLNIVDYRKAPSGLKEIPAIPHDPDARTADLKSEYFYYLVDPSPRFSTEPEPKNQPPLPTAGAPVTGTPPVPGNSAELAGSSPELAGGSQSSAVAVDANRARRLLSLLPVEQAIQWYPFGRDCLLKPKPKSNSGRTIMILDLRPTITDFRTSAFEKTAGDNDADSLLPGKVPGGLLITGEVVRECFRKIDFHTALKLFPEYRRWFRAPKRDERESLPKVQIGVNEGIRSLADLTPSQLLVIPASKWSEIKRLSGISPAEMKRLVADYAPAEIPPVPPAPPDAATVGKWIDLWSKSIEHLPKDPTGYVGRGKCLAKTGHHQTAIGDFTRALELAKTAELRDDYKKMLETDARYCRAMSYYKSADYQRAVEDFTRALELDPKRQYYRDRANAYDHLGKQTLAEADDKEASTLDAY